MPQTIGHLLRSGAAVHTDDVDWKWFECSQSRTDLSSVKHRAKNFDRHLCDHRNPSLFLFKQLKYRRQSRLSLQQILASFD